MKKSSMPSQPKKRFATINYDKIAEKISKLTYEDSLSELELILNKLQAEDLLVDELHVSYYKAKLYLEHCEGLLDKLEQEVQHINKLDSD